MKLEKNTTQTINPLAGIEFITQSFEENGLLQLIDNELGKRVASHGYSYSQIIKNWFQVFYCGGDCAEDIQTHLKAALSSCPDNKVASSDTLLRLLKELATENTLITSSEGNVYNFNINLKLNRLNIKSLLLTKQLVSGQEYDFDYDNQIISTEKFDTKKTYKKVHGYCPGIASIGDNIVYIENRDGNANVKLEQASTLERAYMLLEEQNIIINRSRMDAGSYSKKIIETVAAHSKLFYIRANKSATIYEQLSNIKEWNRIELNYKTYEVASIEFSQFFAEKKFRLVIMRETSNNKQLDMFTGDSLVYRSILTNDWQSTEKEIIVYYNQRGSSEKLFDIMNNDFGWNNLPFSFLNENLSFLLIMAMCKNYYNYIVSRVSLVFDTITPRTRLKGFIFRFVTVSGKWIYKGRQWVLKLFTNRPYELIKI